MRTYHQVTEERIVESRDVRKIQTKKKKKKYFWVGEGEDKYENRPEKRGVGGGCSG